MYRLPNFNLPVNLWRAGTNVLATPDVTFSANLSPGKRIQMDAGGTVFAACLVPETQLLCPAGTDIRFPVAGTGDGDVVEVPANSSRYYFVVNVEDVAKGFANEYRLAWLLKYTTLAGAYFTHPGGGMTSWPFPTP